MGTPSGWRNLHVSMIGQLYRQHGLIDVTGFSYDYKNCYKSKKEFFLHGITVFLFPVVKRIQTNAKKIL
jgi:hypothetical protein